MHRLIEHFQRIAATWLLLEMDWASSRQSCDERLGPLHFLIRACAATIAPFRMINCLPAVRSLQARLSNHGP
jgi:hypothetical protein